jgi:hypothetical protein
MLERNKELLEEQERLEKGGFTGKTEIHWLKGIAKIVDFPRKPLRKVLSEKAGGTDNG